MTNRDEVYKAIDGEREYQGLVWNENTTSCKGIHNNTEFLVYIRDYVDEALHIQTRQASPDCDVFAQHTLRKIAALAVAAMEQNGVLFRDLVK